MRIFTTFIILTAIICTLSFFSSCETAYEPEGKVLYEKYCANCHIENGEGVGTLIPPLAEADFLENNRNDLPCLLRYGYEGEMVVNGKTYNEKMPGVPNLNHIEITNILNYLSKSWGNNAELWKPDDVKKKLDNCSQKKN